ncbi:MAG: transposase [Alphaproteobacteria bacterium]|nr:MAG: transposase [Caulobacteraceae bacterium]TPW04345.1 MAG: transposase [Alphaproteobacteria bacterium]
MKGTHFLTTSRAKTLSLATVFRMSDEEAETYFQGLRWADTDGAPACPACGGLDAYSFRRPTGALQFQCKACKKQFSITSGTLFAAHKAPLRAYLACIAVAMNEVKGKSALALSRDLGMSYKAVWVLLHKVREAMAAEMKGRMVGGEGQVVETDGAYFGGHVRPANLRKDRVDRRFRKNQNGKRKVVVIVRERGGETLPGVFRSEAQALGFIKARVRKDTLVQADEATSWDALHARFEMKRINHQEAYSFDGACTNWAESFFARMRRGEMGHNHHVAGPYLLRYAQEAAWREDNRRVDNGSQVRRVATLALASGPSVDFCGYYQRHRQA